MGFVVVTATLINATFPAFSFFSPGRRRWNREDKDGNGSGSDSIFSGNGQEGRETLEMGRQRWQRQWQRQQQRQCLAASSPTMGGKGGKRWNKEDRDGNGSGSGSVFFDKGREGRETGKARTGKTKMAVVATASSPIGIVFSSNVQELLSPSLHSPLSCPLSPSRSSLSLFSSLPLPAKPLPLPTTRPITVTFPPSSLLLSWPLSLLSVILCITTPPDTGHQQPARNLPLFVRLCSACQTLTRMRRV